MQKIQGQFIFNVCFLALFIFLFSSFVSADDKEISLIYTSNIAPEVYSELLFGEDYSAILVLNTADNFDFGVALFTEDVFGIKSNASVLEKSDEDIGFNQTGFYYFSSFPSIGEGENVFGICLDLGEDSEECTYVFKVFLDTTAPNITLIGSNVINMTLGSIYTELGALAEDQGINLTTNIIIDNSSLDLNKVGTYLINYSVTDDAGNSAYVTRTVIVNAVPISTTTSSGGSGGGGSCSTQWTCTEWSACTDGSQTRTCSYPSNYCAPKSDKPLELRTCTVPVSDTNVTELESQTEQPGFVSTITGNVIGTTAGRWSLGIVVFLIILGLAYWIVSKKRKAAQKPAKKGKK